ncbi:hypothetical protein [Peribacillus huizhouensis]|uniref:Uncharacterized protein n=1 Tax=Peribacillus huizhouensis TaxID=1501239 RepID=A0ABR6CYA5_9BACI|nr:hypothetical protein [Peribacillus huizhouensis]MBA9029277.1 hypothetical protein [Peribacillus huizhouensis]
MDNKRAFLVELHSIIREYSLIEKELKNPSRKLTWEEFNLTEKEVYALKYQSFSPESISAIQKIVRDNIMGAFHDAFSLLDGVSDPTVEKVDDIWVGLRLADVQEDEEAEDEMMLHDELYDSYWDWLDKQEKD